MELVRVPAQVPAYILVPTLHGPLAMLVDGEILVADQGDPEVNDEVARQAAAAFEHPQ